MLLSPSGFPVQVSHQTQEPPFESLPAEPGIYQSASRRSRCRRVRMPYCAAVRPSSTPRRSRTGSTSSALPSPPKPSMPPAPSPPTRGLASLERDFRSIKADDLDLRPIFHRLEDRVRAHVLICMLACYLTWHLRRAWAPLTYADEHPPQRADPVAPPAGQPPRTPRPPAKPDPGASPSAAPATCSLTWPPSPATTCATARSPSPHSPNPPPTSDAPSTSSARSPSV